GHDELLAGTAPRELLQTLDRDLPALAHLLERPLPPDAPAAARVERARNLAILDRLDEAAALLVPLADDPAALVLLGSGRQAQGRWDESDAGYRAALDRLRADLAQKPAARALARAAYDGLAVNARARHDSAAAVSAYIEGLTTVPGDEAYFHFQLGRQYT